MSGHVLLSLQEVTKSFGGVVAVNRVSFDAEAGTIVGVIGPNGAGKTSTFNCITGAYTPDHGAILFEGRPIHRLKPHEIARRGIARTFQNLQIFHNLSVLENVLVARQAKRKTGLLSVMLRLPAVSRKEDQDREQALEMLRAVGLEQHADIPAQNLSFGEQRLLEVARALASEPKLLLLDEPMSGLSREECSAMARLLKKLRATGLAIMLIEHDVATVMEVADKVIVLEFGQKIAEGTPAEVRRNERVIEAYLGKETAAPPRLAAGLSIERPTALQVEHLHAYRGGIHVLRGVSLAVRQGELVALIGANGAGKSTLLGAVSGLLPPASGRVLAKGFEVQALPAEAIVRRGIHHVPERRGMFAELTVEESLRLGAYYRLGWYGGGKEIKRQVEGDVERIYQMFPRLKERRTQLAGTLSGGEQQMLAIARGLMAHPDVLLLDEPSLGLAPLIVFEIFETLRALADQGMAILLVEQNARAALRIADRAYVLERGEIRYEGDPASLWTDEQLNRAYLSSVGS